MFPRVLFRCFSRQTSPDEPPVTADYNELVEKEADLSIAGGVLNDALEVDVETGRPRVLQLHSSLRSRTSENFADAEDATSEAYKLAAKIHAAAAAENADAREKSQERFQTWQLDPSQLRPLQLEKSEAADVDDQERERRRREVLELEEKFIKILGNVESERKRIDGTERKLSERRREADKLKQELEAVKLCVVECEVARRTAEVTAASLVEENRLLNDRLADMMRLHEEDVRKAQDLLYDKCQLQGKCEHIDRQSKQLVEEEAVKGRDVAARLQEALASLDDERRRAAELEATTSTRRPVDSDEVGRMMQQLRMDAEAARRDADELRGRLAGRDAVTKATNLRQLFELVHKSAEIKELLISMSPPCSQPATLGRRRKSSITSNLGISCISDTPQPHKEKLQKLSDALSLKLDARRAAVEMFQRDSLTVTELESILNTRQSCRAVKLLLDVLFVATRETFDCFMESLRYTEQHGVYVTIACADFSDQFPHNSQLRRQYLFLVDNIDCCRHSTPPLTSLLVDADVLSQAEKTEIDEELIAARRNEKLLAALSVKSLEQFQTFLRVIDCSGQHQIADRIRDDSVSC